MKKQVYEIDENGFILKIHVAEVDGDERILEEDKINFIITDPPNGLYKIKWNGFEWVEGESETERLERVAEQQLESILPSPNEIEEAELEIKVITLLTELGVI